MNSFVTPSAAEHESMSSEAVRREAPALEDVLDALDDPDCRTILRLLDEPLTVSELTDSCEIPESTMYRKLDLLSDASLVETQMEIRTDGCHTRRFAVNFDEVRLSLTDERALEVAIDREESDPEQRLSALWSDVRNET